MKRSKDLGKRKRIRHTKVGSSGKPKQYNGRSKHEQWDDKLRSHFKAAVNGGLSELHDFEMEMSHMQKRTNDKDV